MSSSKKFKKELIGNEDRPGNFKRLKGSSQCVDINKELHAVQTKSALTKAFSDKVPCYIENVAELICKPFTLCSLHNFLSSTDAIEGLKNELFDIDLHPKNNDLYKFHQSGDLKEYDTPYIQAFRQCLTTQLHPWLKEVTGIPLDGTISLTCSKYTHTDTLLCHDDELEGRRIAFILYLVPNWEKADGGTLDLFDTDSDGQPRDVVTSLVPRSNTIVFFEVTPVSFHQVAEVLSEDKVRLSVGGWFHGPPVERPEPYVEPLPLMYGHCAIEEEVFRSWINPTYLIDEIGEQIRTRFKNESEIHLEDFLQEERCKAVEAALRASDMKWRKRGPPNRRNIFESDGELPPIVDECLRVFRSEAMFLILSSLTGLKLHELATFGNSDSDAEDSNDAGSGGDGPRCRYSLRRWSHGNYTLAHDDDKDMEESALDAVLYFNCGDWKQEYGGFTTYITRDEDEELLTVGPASNSLALVYRDQGILRFVKHINDEVSRLPKDSQCFHDLFLVYYE
ncbi:prolyl 3-hydroxylase OGFOD1-like [Ornithodoros turicata]|uniref:prolyl 3-hydroxylase OGFOD1-like n=1 Tax=Ornithodoros turicata TaxID=34597 RepID=UPI00313948C7